MSPLGMLVVQNTSGLKSKKRCDASEFLRYMAPEIIRGEGYSGATSPRPVHCPKQRWKSQSKSTVIWTGHKLVGHAGKRAQDSKYMNSRCLHPNRALFVQQALRLMSGRWVWRMSQLMRATPCSTCSRWTCFEVPSTVIVKLHVNMTVTVRSTSPSFRPPTFSAGEVLMSIFIIPHVSTCYMLVIIQHISIHIMYHKLYHIYNII